MEYESKLSDIIASLPEVSGGFLYAPDRGIYSNQTVGFASEESLQQAAMKLTKIVSMLSVHFHDTGSMRISFNDLILFGTPIAGDHWLFLLHQPALSPGMIRMTVQMALNIDSEQVGQTEIPDLSLPDESVQDIAVESLGDIMDRLLSPGSELNKPLRLIKEQLAQYIGPVSELIFQDSIEEWASQSTPSLENLSEFFSMLEGEIDDEDDRKKFRECLNTIEGA